MANKQEKSSSFGEFTGMVVFGTIIAFGVAQTTGLSPAEALQKVILGKSLDVDKLPGRLKQPGFNVPKRLGNVTVRSRASTKEYENLFGCDLQSDLTPDPEARDRATSAERKCAKYVAAVIGKNSYGWGPRQQKALDELWTRESVWSANADNPNSSAFGIPQAMTSERLHGPQIARDYKGAASYYNNTVSQIQWGLDYIHDRYGTPIEANDFWEDQCGGKNGCRY